MSRTKKLCPRRLEEMSENQVWHKCKCEWCMNLQKKKLKRKNKLSEIKEAIISFENGELL